MQTDKENFRANEAQVATHLRETVREKERLTQELSNTQRVVNEYKKECESLVVDYQGAAKKIAVLEEERDRYRNQANMSMRELGQRGERVKALEGERKNLQEQLQHMDLQVGVWGVGVWVWGCGGVRERSKFLLHVKYCYTHSIH